MSQKNKMLVSLAATLVLCGGVGAYAYFGVFQKEKEEQVAKEAEAKLFHLDRDEIEALTVKGKGDTTQLEKREGSWWVVSPITSLADQDQVESLLGRLASARRTKVILEDADLASFGLEEPAVYVEARTGDGESAYLAVGLQSTFDRSYYVSNAPRLVLAGDSSMKTLFEKGTFDLRDKSVIVFGEDAVSSLKISGEQSVSLTREDGGWALTSPLESKADEKEVQNILRELRNLKAVAFPDEATLGLEDRPTVEVTLERSGGDPLKLLVWEAEDKVFAKGEGGPIAEVGKSLLETLRKEPKELQDRRIAPFDTNEVAKASFVIGEETFTVEKKGDEWEIVQPSPAKAKRWRITSSLSNLSDLKEVEILPGSTAAEHGLDTPERTVQLYDDSGKSILTLYLGKEEDGFTYGRLEGKDEVYKLTSSHMGNLPRSLEDILDEVPAASED